ncbi:MAG: FAD-dependent oxidoreductase [Acetobacteraceae bacterium]|nr:FAD-dependent oxidoreductase [Acetobacteraceae bacterium]
MADNRYDVIVIGAGSGGLTAAGGCGLYGLKTALIERDRMGGECLNTGCVPSKALLAAAASAQGVRQAARFGVRTSPPEVDFAAVRAHVQRAIEAIAPHDSAETMAGYGVDTLRGEARFLSPYRVAVGAEVLTAPQIVIATGSHPAIPPIPGLAETPYLTNETLWQLDTLPSHLVILGGGPVGVEMAQAFRRLGAAVTLVDTGTPLARFDGDAAALVLSMLRTEGVEIRADTEITRVTPGPRLHCAAGAPIEASHILVAAGRKARTQSLELGQAGVAVGPDGITVDDTCRTNVKGIYAIGDCRAGPRLTHMAGHDGTVVVQNIALGVPAKVERDRFPQAIYTHPELAQLGPTEAEARRNLRAVTTETVAFADNDRAVAEGEVAGFVKLVLARGRTVGVTIVGTGAGDLLLPWSQVLAGKASRFALSGTIVAYPTRSEASKAAAFASLRPTLFNPALKRWARLLALARRIP